MHSSEERGTKHAPGPVLLPKIVWPDGSVQNDSTFLVERLEKDYSARCCYPEDKGLTFLALLLEDFADEFLTKCMYHYRWVHDPLYAGKAIAMQQQGLLSASDEGVTKFGANVQKRQVGRLGIVGSNPVTGPAIEQFYEEFLQTLDEHFQRKSISSWDKAKRSRFCNTRAASSYDIARSRHFADNTKIIAASM